MGMQILHERTDEEHILNAAEIGQILQQEYDMKAMTIAGFRGTSRLSPVLVHENSET